MRTGAPEMDAIETYLRENALTLGLGIVGGVALVIFLIIAIAMGGRRPPDK